MSNLAAHSMDILDARGLRIGSLLVSLLPLRSKEKTSGLPSLSQSVDGRALLVEGTEYRYEVQTPHPGDIAIDVTEMFYPDTDSGRTGRLRTGEYVGTVKVGVTVGMSQGACWLEVISTKLGYETHYQLMLRDLAEVLAESILHRFAPSTQELTVDAARDSNSLYQRFCFLSSIFQNPSFDLAIHQIISDPYVKWDVRTEPRNPSAGVRASSAVARELARPGPRVYGSSSISLPASINVQYSEETRDNIPNRFIKYVLLKWQAEVAAVAAALETERPGAPVRRGIAAVRAASVYLEELLGAELFRSVGALHYFPSDNPVIQSREGYREVMYAYLVSELAGKLSWTGGDDVYGAGKKDVATLYEYWVFLQLGKVVSGICGNDFALGSLLEIGKDGLSFGLRRSKQCAIAGSVERLNRQVRVELWFNRGFSKRQMGFGSWSRPLRPDMSLLVRPQPDTATTFEPIWLHFDAKYRVSKVRDLFDEVEPDSPTQEPINRAMSPDLAKMHAYRDAIRRSAGAFVIYPGTEQEVIREYEEILPGLGAFPLVPGMSGPAAGERHLAAFINDVITHACSQVTQHERARFWEREAYRTEPAPQVHVHAAPHLARPPADTLVLLGYVRGARHLDWIRSVLRYNLRGDRRSGSVRLGSTELSAPYVLLYGSALPQPELWHVSGYPELRTGEQLDRTGYPGARGSLYFCLPLQLADTQPVVALETLSRITAMQPRGAPRVVRWDVIAGSSRDA